MSHKSQTNNYTEFFYKAFRNILIISIPLVIISAIILSSSFSQAEASHVNKDQVSLSILPSCTLSVDQSASTPHTVSILNGTYESDIGKTRVIAFCNDMNGYNIYAIGYTNNEDGNTKLIGRSLNANGGLLGNEYDINTGTAISGNTSNWAMKLTGGTGVDAPVVRPIFADYASVPDNLTMIAYRESGTHMSSSDAMGAYFDTTYRAYVTSNQPAGTYTGQVKYVLDHPYNPDPLYDIEDAYYAFGNEKVYLMNDGTVLYSAPTASETEEHGGLAGRYYAMQDMHSMICGTVDLLGDDGAAQLVDVRDGKLYWTTKLKDNNCWMTQNLDLNLSSSVALTSETSDIDPATYGAGIYTQADGYSVDSNNVVSWLPSTIVEVDDGQGGTTQAQRADTIVMNNNTATNWAVNNNNPYSADPGEKYRYTNPSSYNEETYISLEACANNNGGDTVGCQHSHLGNYYNWTASLASNNSANATGNPVNSICPKNWNLPTRNEYTILLTAQGIFSSNSSYVAGGFNKLRTAPLYFQRFGYVGSSRFLSGLGELGLYWPSTNSNAEYAYSLRFNDSNIWPNQIHGGWTKAVGYNIRCMVDTD